MRVMRALAFSLLAAVSCAERFPAVRLARFADVNPGACGGTQQTGESSIQLGLRALKKATSLTLTFEVSYAANTRYSKLVYRVSLPDLGKDINGETKESTSFQVVLTRSDIDKIVANQGKLRVGATIVNPGDWCAGVELVDVVVAK